MHMQDVRRSGERRECLSTVRNTASLLPRGVFRALLCTIRRSNGSDVVRGGHGSGNACLLLRVGHAL